MLTVICVSSALCDVTRGTNTCRTFCSTFVEALRAASQRWLEVQHNLSFSRRQKNNIFWQRAASSGLKQDLAVCGGSTGPKDGNVSDMGSCGVIPLGDLMAATSSTLEAGGGRGVRAQLPSAWCCYLSKLFFFSSSDPPPSTRSLDPPEKEPTAAFSSSIICQIAITCEPSNLPAWWAGLGHSAVLSLWPPAVRKENVSACLRVTVGAKG